MNDLPILLEIFDRYCYNSAYINDIGKSQFFNVWYRGCEDTETEGKTLL